MNTSEKNAIRNWKWFLLLSVMLLVAFRISKEFSVDYPSELELDNFQVYKQPDGVSCGPTSVRMVLNYYDKHHSLDEIRTQTKTDWIVNSNVEIGGTTVEYIEKALDHFEVPSDLSKGTVEDLKKYVARGTPPIILLRSGAGPYWHYVVVIGYTETEITIADPSGRISSYEIPRFERAWGFTHNLYSGDNVTYKCFACGGDGRILDLPDPFGKCDICAGTGEIQDLYLVMMKLGEQGTFLLVAPKEPPKP